MMVKQQSILWAGGALWLAVVTGGMWKIAMFENTPGTVVAVSRDWPRNSAIRLSGSVPTLVMAVHPQCPCTRASIAELAHVLAAASGHVQTELLFILPSGTKPGWEKTDLWKSAAALPGVTVRSDPGGREAARFGAETSGQCFLFDTNGRLRFTGGITASRGHEGDNDGREALVSLLTRGTPGRETTPVFGCPLLAPQ